MQNRILNPNIRVRLLKEISALPSDIKVYDNKITGRHEVWIKGCYVMDFKKLDTGVKRKIGYRFSQHNRNIDTEKELNDFEEYRKKQADKLTDDMINAMANEIDKYGNKNAVNFSVLPKR